MIITESVNVEIKSGNIKYFDSVKIGDIINVSINDLNKGSKSFIRVKCDNCGVEKELMYKFYNSYGYSQNEYLCKSCKMKKNNLKKYGVENIFQLDSTKEKSKETCKEKYGVENISQNETIKKKKEKTSIKKYGCKHHLQNKNILNKQKLTNLFKYGVENVSQIESIKKKKENTCLSNNNVKFIFLDNDFKNKLKKLNLKKYGVEFILQSTYIKNKIKLTNKKKYGFDFASQSDIVKQKIKLSNIKKCNDKTMKNIHNLIEIKNDDSTFLIKCEKCNKIFEINRYLYYKRKEYDTIICTYCNPINKHVSGKELQLLNFIKENYSGEIIENDRKILNGKELDIYLPELKLAFEFNGLYWHSNIY
ncbi:hypothetical protein M0Q97_11575, partial [Candidatus Dojkabacteria bacterium]|nr:hypothetical protein [Candidatus Dojkabacteria bacterium]